MSESFGRLLRWLMRDPPEDQAFRARKIDEQSDLWNRAMANEHGKWVRDASTRRHVLKHRPPVALEAEGETIVINDLQE